MERKPNKNSLILQVVMTLLILSMVERFLFRLWFWVGTEASAVGSVEHTEEVAPRLGVPSLLRLDDLQDERVLGQHAEHVYDAGHNLGALCTARLSKYK